MSEEFPPRYEGMYLLVEWLDSGAHHVDGWQTKYEIRNVSLSTVTTAGYCFLETDGKIYVGQSWDENNEHFFGTQIIAKTNIRHCYPIYWGPTVEL